MVEYFGEQLSGFAFTANGWVQSYGSRCVKPPIIYGDVSRPKPMTVFWSSTAQSLTKRPMKGMLTGPVTILNWSFVRDDQPRYENLYCHLAGLSDGFAGYLSYLTLSMFLLDLKHVTRLLWLSRMRLRILRMLVLLSSKLMRLL